MAADLNDTLDAAHAHGRTEPGRLPGGRLACALFLTGMGIDNTSAGFISRNGGIHGLAS